MFSACCANEERASVAPRLQGAVEEPAVVGEPVQHDRDRSPIRTSHGRDIIKALFVSRGLDIIYPLFSSCPR
jgi:hypothetical protein